MNRYIVCIPAVIAMLLAGLSGISVCVRANGTTLWADT
jgi:hypothetical protein